MADFWNYKGNVALVHFANGQKKWYHGTEAEIRLQAEMETSIPIVKIEHFNA